jgi:hypothetical protein
MHRRIFTHDPRIPGMAHGGDLFYFHTDLLLLPEHDLGLFVSFNSDSGSDARDWVVPLFLDRYYPATQAAPPVPAADFASRTSRFAGYYRTNRHPYETMEKLTLLAFGDVKISAGDSGGLVLDFMGYQARIVEIEPLLFQVVSGGLPLGSDFIAFGEDPSGEITQVYAVPTMALYRLAWYETAAFHFALLASCLAIFSAASVGAIRRRRMNRSGTPLARWRCRLTIGLSAVNIAFSVGFGLMLAGAMETGLIPDGVFYLLILPVSSVLLTACVVFLIAWEWKTSAGTRRQRGFGTIFGLAALAYLWFLDFWNLLGWHY